MLRTCVLAALCISTISWGQNHAENFQVITTPEQAEEYASSFREVFTANINMESDVFFFDDIDTSNMASYVGITKSFFGKTTKLLQDSLFNVVNIQVIRFDLKKVAPETAEILAGQMKKLLEQGQTYWDLKTRFSHTSARFISSPEVMEEVTEKYDITEAQMTKDSYHEWKTEEESMGFVIIDKESHQVPGFCAISYLNLNNGNVR
jgi:hypothetical protein